MEEKERKLVIQIPCLNEAAMLPKTFKEIPRRIEGISRIETLVIDDGSADGTHEAAKDIGVDHIIKFRRKKGLAKAFIAGIDASLNLGADIIVNLDADGQYDPNDIPKLIRPIMDGEADVVIGDREIENLKHFSFVKKKLQTLGSWGVRKISGTAIPDVTSGFRAFSREAAMSINIVSDFTYTVETLIQAGVENLALGHVKVRSRKVARKSRLFNTIWGYIKRTLSTIVRVYTMYKPLKVFSLAAGAVIIIGVLLFIRFLHFHFTGTGTRHIAYLIVSAIVTLLGFQIFMIGLLADLISNNRKLIENALKRIKKQELSEREP